MTCQSTIRHVATLLLLFGFSEIMRTRDGGKG